MSESEFGKGLVLCLVKFAEHRMKLHEDLRVYKEMEAKCQRDGGQDGLFSESSCIEMHFNGASDHLCEIEVPKGKEWDYIRRKVRLLQKRGLEIGHGFNLEKKWTAKEALALYGLAQEIAILIDKKLGLAPEKGQW